MALHGGIPIPLPAGDQYDNITEGQEIALLNKEGHVLAIMTADEKFELDLENFAAKCFGTTEDKHPGVAAIKRGETSLSPARLKWLIVQFATIRSMANIFLTLLKQEKIFAKRGWNTIVAFQTRNPIHRAHEYLIKCAQEIVDGALIHPIVGETKSDDIPADTRMRCYEALIAGYFNPANTFLSVLPTAMRYAGPREAINHAHP